MILQHIRIATWNIGGGFVATHSDLQFDTEDLAYFSSVLQPLACDVVCLQEVHTPIIPAQSGQTKQLAETLGMPYWVTIPCDTQRASHLRSNQFLSLAILSRWNLHDAYYNKFPNPQLQTQTKSGATWISHDKGFLKARLWLASREITILCGHTVPFNAFARDEMEDAFAPVRNAMEAIILESSYNPTIVVGDLNCEQIERLLPHVFEKGYSRTLVGVGTEPKMGRQLDHILVSPHWRVLQSNVIHTRADHYLCYADLALVAD